MSGMQTYVVSCIYSSIDPLIQWYLYGYLMSVGQALKLD